MVTLIMFTVIFFLVNDFLRVTKDRLEKSLQQDWKKAVTITIVSYLEVITLIGLYVSGYVLTCEVLGNVVM